MGNDTINGFSGNDQLFGETGNDSLIGGSEDDTLYGGEGNDVAVFSGASADYEITEGDESVTVTNISDNGDGTDVLRQIQRIEFSDQTIEINLPDPDPDPNPDPDPDPDPEPTITPSGLIFGTQGDNQNPAIELPAETKAFIGSYPLTKSYNLCGGKITTSCSWLLLGTN